MTTKPYAVFAPEVGLETDMEPWLIPDTAYASLQDAYIWRKRILRRKGNRFLGRLVEQNRFFDPLAVSGAAVSYTNPTALPVPVRPSSVLVTINTLTFTDNGSGVMLNNSSASAGSIDYNTGILTVTFGAIGAGPYNVFIESDFYPIRPAMGITTQEIAVVNSKNTFAFDTVKSNVWNSSTGYFDDNSFYSISEEPIRWTGTDTNFFAGRNYQDALFVTNNVFGYHVQQITAISKTAPNTTLTFAHNVLQIGDTLFVFGVTDDPDEALNNQTFTVTASTATTVTFVANSTNVTSNDGTAFLNEHSGYLLGQNITGITTGATTVITFGANTITAGQRVIVDGVTGTVGVALNGQSFVVSSATGISITLPIKTTGLAYIAQGTAVVPVGDGIRWYDTTNPGWNNFNPPLNGDNALKGGLFLIPYRDRLIVLAPYEGTIEGTDSTQQFQRARWSQNGTVFYSGKPTTQTAEGVSWRDDIPGRGGYIDAATSEKITSFQFIRDSIIVTFESSCWLLRYTGNEALPFAWVRINVEFGSRSPFSLVPFDKGILAIDGKGIISIDGNNAERIDTKIPSQVWNFQDALNGPLRVHGIRDFFNELVYWTYVDTSSRSSPAPTFPDRLLVYNYREQSWSVFIDSYTCFGNFFASKGLNWEDADVNWEDADFTWDSPDDQPSFPDIIAGTNAGYIMYVDQYSQNGIQIPISGITKGNQAVVTCPCNHNLESGMYVKFANVQGMTEINGLNTQITVLTLTTFLCVNVNSTAFTTYTSGGDLIRLNNMQILTKRFNPYTHDGISVFINKVDLYLDYILNGRITLNVYVDNNSTVSVSQNQTGSQQYWQSIVNLDSTTTDMQQSQIWTRLHCHTRGQFIQLEFKLSDEQMLSDLTNTESFALHGFIMYLGRAGRLIS